MRVKDLFDLGIFCCNEEYEIFFCSVMYPNDDYADYVGSISGEFLNILNERVIRFIGCDNGKCSLYLLK